MQFWTNVDPGSYSFPSVYAPCPADGSPFGHLSPSSKLVLLVRCLDAMTATRCRAIAVSKPSPIGSRAAAMLLASTFALVLCLVGCADPPSVETRTVPKKDRTLVAYIPQGEVVWFVKLSGPTAFVDPLEDDFRAIIGSMEFDDDGEPKVSLPDGWSKQPQKSMRFATYSKDGPMEIAVTQLAASDPQADDYIALNINRWLRELGQPPREGNWREEAEKRGEFESIEVAGTDGYLFDLRGNVLPARSALIITAEPYLDYTVPEGWIEKPGDSFRLAIFGVPGDAEATISSAGGDPVANINRWEGQLGLPPTPNVELRDRLKAVEVSGQPALWIRLDGERAGSKGDEPVPTSTIGVIAADGEKQYFLKLIGPTEAIEAAEDDFRKFLSSIDF